MRVLQEGSSAKARGYGRGNNKENDELSIQMQDFYQPLLDHGALWKVKNDNVICTAMPYGDRESITDGFYRMVNMFHYMETMKMEFLDDKYRFLINGDHMIANY